MIVINITIIIIIIMLKMQGRCDGVVRQSAHSSFEAASEGS